MQKILFFVSLVKFLITIANGEIDNTISSLSIKFDKKQEGNKFPLAFHIELKSLKNGFVEFVKINSDSKYPIDKANIFTIDSIDTNKVVEVSKRSTDMVS